MAPTLPISRVKLSAALGLLARSCKRERQKGGESRDSARRSRVLRQVCGVSRRQDRKGLTGKEALIYCALVSFLNYTSGKGCKTCLLLIKNRKSV